MTTTERLVATVRDVPNFPKEGILFKDITPVLGDAELCENIVYKIIKDYAESGLYNIDAIAGVESRGFFFGFLLANKLGVPFIPIRKAGKLPFTTVSKEYDLEYGTAVIEMNSDAVTKGMNVLIHDDLLATGGTAAAAAELIQEQGGNVAGFNFIITLDFLKGSENLSKFSNNIYEIKKY
jgi:adenine phosphoribosyltransferase